MNKENQIETNKFFVSFIPSRLEIENRPELSNFPLNVLFAGWKIENGQLIQATAIYEPDFLTFGEKDEEQRLKYGNRYGDDCWLEIFYNKKQGTYHGRKYVNGKQVVSADGTHWQGFFFHFTTPGLFNGERCFFEPLFEQEESPIEGFKSES